jgi:hypothetical protein
MRSIPAPHGPDVPVGAAVAVAIGGAAGASPVDVGCASSELATPRLVALTFALAFAPTFALTFAFAGTGAAFASPGGSVGALIERPTRKEIEITLRIE